MSHRTKPTRAQIDQLMVTWKRNKMDSAETLCAQAIFPRTYANSIEIVRMLDRMTQILKGAKPTTEQDKWLDAAFIHAK